eukprot:445457-Prorocentrum_lima.AAC.1
MDTSVPNFLMEKGADICCLYSWRRSNASDVTALAITVSASTPLLAAVHTRPQGVGEVAASLMIAA